MIASRRFDAGGRRWQPYRLRSRMLIGAICLPLGLDAGAAAMVEQPPPPTLAELVQVADLSGLAASPDGRLVAFRVDRPSLGRNSYDLAWHILDLERGVVVDVGSGGEPIIEDPGRVAAEPPVWSPDSRWIYYRALREGEVQLWRSAADGSSMERVTAEPGDVRSIELDADGSGLIYEVGPARDDIIRAELDEYETGILVDAHVELGQNLFRGATINGRPATQRLTNRWFERGGVLHHQPPIHRKLDFETLMVSDVEPAVATAASTQSLNASVQVRSRRGDVAEARWDGQVNRLTVRLSDDTGAVTCAARPCREDRIGWLAWRPGRAQLVFATAGAARVQSLHLWDVASGQVRTLIEGEGLLSGGRDPRAPCAVASAFIVCVAASPASPPRLMVIDLASLGFRTYYDPNARLRQRAWPRHERLRWEGAGGQIYTGVMFLPPRSAASPAPLFVNYYQCDGFVRGGAGDEWPFAALAGAGIVSVCGNMTEAGAAEDGVGRYRAAEAGIRALIDLLAARGLVDRGRVGLGGLSFGSEVTMWMMIHSDLVAAASVASPQFEPANYWFNNVRGRDHGEVLRRFWGLGAPDETPERWQLLSPALNVSRITAPLLLQLPEQEARYAVELYARLSHSPTPTEMYVFPDERHVKTQPRHRLAVYRRNIDWFRFWLQDHVDPAPAKTEQYRRWRALAQRARTAGQPARDLSQSSSEARSNRRK